MLTPNGFDRIHLSLASGLIKDEIKIEEYVRQRGLSTRVILSEVKYLVGNPIKFNLFLISTTNRWSLHCDERSSFIE